MTGPRLPDAVVIGAPKAGTTTLCAALARHPEVFMCPGKETHFFNHYYETRGLDWYCAHFRGATASQLVMEGTPDYAMSNHVAQTVERMVKHIPDAKLIFMVRNPVERIESHYIQMLSNKRKVLPITEALAQWPEIIATSDYGAILRHICSHYPREQILVLFLDDYAKDKDRFHARVLAFLGLDGSPRSLEQMRAQGAAHTRSEQAMDGAVLAWLRRRRGFGGFHGLVPRPLIRLGKKMLRRPITVSSRLDPVSRQKLIERFDPGWQAFQTRHRHDA